MQARLSEIQKALKETKAVQEMKEQVLLFIHLLQTLFTSCKPSYLLNLTHLLRTDEIFSKHLAYGHLNLGKFNYSARTNTKDYG